ncbi:MAG: hypothetical protein K0R70_1678, partial [Steroidobacteraceae bacterium]|nr:hypothetical protein [Steroidobacteraceae bacterium]
MTVSPLPTPEQRTTSLLLAILAFAAVIFGGGAWLYERETRRIRAQKIEEIESIATLKVAQIASWRDERLMDARFGAHGPYFVQAMDQWTRGTLDDTG